MRSPEALLQQGWSISVIVRHVRTGSQHWHMSLPRKGMRPGRHGPFSRSLKSPGDTLINFHSNYIPRRSTARGDVPIVLGYARQRRSAVSVLMAHNPQEMERTIMTFDCMDRGENLETDPMSRVRGDDLERVEKEKSLRQAALMRLNLRWRDPRLDERAREAATAVGYPNGLINLVGVKQTIGGAFMEAGELPFTEVEDLETGFCPHVLAKGLALPLGHVGDYPRFHSNDIVRLLGTESYLGTPLVDSNGTQLGTLCVLDKEPHHLTRGHVATIKSIAAKISKEIADPRWNQPAAP